MKFPEKLMRMITYAEEELAPTFEKPDSCCLGWMPDGESFIIRDNEEFCKTLLPRYFPQGANADANFTRNLYRWGFSQRMKINSNSCSYGHRAFKRGSTDYLKHMSTKTDVANNKKREASEITHVPTAVTMSSPSTGELVPDSSISSGVVGGLHSGAQRQTFGQQISPDIASLPTPSSNIEVIGALLAQHRIQQAVSTHATTLNLGMNDYLLSTAASLHHGAVIRQGRTIADQVHLNNSFQERLHEAVMSTVASQQIAALQSNLAGLQHNAIALSPTLSLPASTPFSTILQQAQEHQYVEQQQTLLRQLLNANTNTANTSAGLAISTANVSASSPSSVTATTASSQQQNEQLLRQLLLRLGNIGGQQN